MSLVEHLGDLRKTFIYSLASLFAGSITAYLHVNKIVTFLKRPLSMERLVFFNPTEAFLVNIKIALLAGLILSLPAILASFAWFIAPGLTHKEKRLFTILGLVSSLLFVLGTVVAYFGALPSVLKFLSDFTPKRLVPYFSVSRYISFILNFILLFGLGFQLPFLIFVLVFMGLLSPKLFKRYRKYIILTVLGLGLLLAPGADIFTQILLFSPLYILCELSVLLAVFFKKRMRAHQLRR